MSRKKPPRAPRHVAGVQQVAATPPTVHHDGRVWRLGFNTQDAKGRLEELFRSHVVRDAIKTKRLLGGADGDEHYRLTDTLLKQGYYKTFAKGWVELLNSPEGALLYVLSLLQEHHPDTTADEVAALLAAEPEQVEAAVLAVSPDFFEAVAVQMKATPGAAREFARTVAARMTAAPGGGSPS